jgi:hypothetical protein
MTGTNCDLFTHNQSQSYLDHLVFMTHIQKMRLEMQSSVTQHTDFTKTCHKVLMAHTDVTSFMLTRHIQYAYANFHETHKCSTALCAHS